MSPLIQESFGFLKLNIMISPNAASLNKPFQLSWLEPNFSRPRENFYPRIPLGKLFKVHPQFKFAHRVGGSKLINVFKFVGEDILFGALNLAAEFGQASCNSWFFIAN